LDSIKGKEGQGACLHEKKRKREWRDSYNILTVTAEKKRKKGLQKKN